MPFVSTAALTKVLSGPNARHVASQMRCMVNDVPTGGNVTAESVQRVMDSLRGYIMARGYFDGKYLRPWEVDQDMYSSLNRDEPWYGFEFETGYRSYEARSEMLAYTWDTWDNVAYDSEGEGNAAVEITFGPVERSRFLNGDAPALEFARYLASRSDLTMQSGTTGVGTHINISWPWLTADNSVAMMRSLNAMISGLPNEVDGENVRLKMFGRASLYGGWYRQVRHEGVWLEGKLFRTTYDADQFDNYMRTVEALNKCAEAVNAASAARPLPDMKEYKWATHRGLFDSSYGGILRIQNPYLTVDNLYDVYANGAEPNVIVTATRTDINYFTQLVAPPSDADKWAPPARFAEWAESDPENLLIPLTPYLSGFVYYHAGDRVNFVWTGQKNSRSAEILKTIQSHSDWVVLNEAAAVEDLSS